MSFLVGATGFEPATFATPLQRATKLRHAPLPLLAVTSLPQDGAYTSGFLDKWKALLALSFQVFVMPRPIDHRLILALICFQQQIGHGIVHAWGSHQ